MRLREDQDISRPASLTTVFLEYARAMQQAQLFEAALQFIAAMELDSANPQLDDDPLSRTEWFFSRPIHWLQRRLDFPRELVAEIDQLRKARNELAHGYLVRLEFTEPDEEAEPESAWWSQMLDEMPPAARADYERQVRAAGEAASHERREAATHLRALTARFKECNSQLYARSLARIPHASSWEEVEERFLRAADPRPPQEGDG